MAYDARAIANCVLKRAKQQKFAITNMALNKILYFSHGWYLASNGEPLVNYQFEAWEHGPVLPTIYHQFKRFGDRPIAGLATMIDLDTGADTVAECELIAGDDEFVDRMVAFYGPKSGVVLSLMSHEFDAPWSQVRKAQARPGMIISDSLIREYFLARLKTGARQSDAH